MRKHKPRWNESIRLPPLLVDIRRSGAGARRSCPLLVGLFASMLAIAPGIAQSATGNQPALATVPHNGAPTAKIEDESLPPETDPSLIRGEDGALDVGNFLDKAYGFIPVVVPITEPALGLGAVGALAFIDRPEPGSGFNRPNITLIGGAGTEKGTRGYFGGDMRYWLDNRLHTLVGGIKTGLNLDFYGNGRGGGERQAHAYTLDLTGGLLRGRYRLGDSDNWLGVSYVLADTRARFDHPLDMPLNEHAQRISGLGVGINHDTRDNIFTPRSGNYLEAGATVFAPALGSDLEFIRYSLTGIQYIPLPHRASLGINGSLSGNAGDTPFYMSPYVSLRGVPAMRYQGQRAAQLEAEVLWPIRNRYSLVGFAGVGDGFGGADNAAFDDRGVVAGGVGLRYEIARKYGMHMGLDLAWSRDGPAVYVQFGSAWMRP